MLGVLARTVIGTYASIHVCHTYVASVTWVDGPSMMPTIPNTKWNIVLVSVLHKHFGLMHTGDMVLSISPLDPAISVVKRIVAVAGDRVEPQRHGGSGPPTLVGRAGRQVVPVGHVWVEGDNPARSRDSRLYGALPAALLRGVVVAQIWPPSRWQVFRRQVPPCSASTTTTTSGPQ